MATTEPSSSLADRVQSLRLPPPGGGSSSSARLPWFLCLVLAGAVGYLLVMGSPWKPVASIVGGDSAESASSATKPNTSTTGSTTASPASVSGTGAAVPAGEIVLESKGYIIPEQQILVSPQVSGRVIELYFEAGQRVEKGFVLAVLDNAEYLAEYDRVKATLESSQESLAELREGSRPDEVKQAKADLAEAQTNLKQAEKDLARAKDLFEKKITQPQDLENAKSQYDALVQRVEKLTATSQLIIDGPRRERKRMAEAQVRQIEAELRRAKWRLDNCRITTPISGTILKKNAELGNLVNPVAFNGSFSLCDVADLSKLEVELSIQERDIAKVFKGQACKVRAEAYPKRIYEGVVSRLLPIADRAKGAVPVRVRLTVSADEEGGYLKPEMGATVQFYAAPSQVSIPKDATVVPSNPPVPTDFVSPPTATEQPTIPDATEPAEVKQ